MVYLHPSLRYSSNAYAWRFSGVQSIYCVVFAVEFDACTVSCGAHCNEQHFQHLRNASCIKNGLGPNYLWNAQDFSKGLQWRNVDCDCAWTCVSGDNDRAVWVVHRGAVCTDGAGEYAEADEHQGLQGPEEHQLHSGRHDRWDSSALVSCVLHQALFLLFLGDLP